MVLGPYHLSIPGWIPIERDLTKVSNGNEVKKYRYNIRFSFKQSKGICEDAYYRHMYIFRVYIITITLVFLLGVRVTRSFMLQI